MASPRWRFGAIERLPALSQLKGSFRLECVDFCAEQVAAGPIDLCHDCPPPRGQSHTVALRALRIQWNRAEKSIEIGISWLDQPENVQAIPKRWSRWRTNAAASGSEDLHNLGRT